MRDKAFMLTKTEHFIPDSIDNVHQFEALFNFATIGMIITNNEGNIINFNKHAETQFGYSKNEILGKSVDILLPASAQERHVKYREGFYHHPEPRIMGHGRDLFALNKQGNTFPVEVSLSHFTIKNATYVIAFVIDITVRKTHEAKATEQKHALQNVTAEIKSLNQEQEQKVEDRTKMLREALSELERSKDELNLAFENEKELSELKSRFATMASHEFRTPLSTILSSAYLLGKYTEFQSDTKVQKHILRIEDAVDGMKIILEEFLSLGKLEEGLVQTNTETVSPLAIETIVNGLLEEHDAISRISQSIHFNNLVDRDVQIDTNLIKNTFINLLSNAVKFSGENGKISITTAVIDKNFMMSVEDDGIGISEDDQQHLFERFFRAKNAINIQGTGLGLHIVSKYLELMNGSINIKSKLNEGTTVTIYVPQ
ncbi:MAG: PAS domain-containing sensor histidine kinase [Chitinophagaceae bacterium]